MFISVYLNVAPVAYFLSFAVRCADFCAMCFELGQSGTDCQVHSTTLLFLCVVCITCGCVCVGVCERRAYLWVRRTVLVLSMMPIENASCASLVVYVWGQVQLGFFVRTLSLSHAHAHTSLSLSFVVALRNTFISILSLCWPLCDTAVRLFKTRLSDKQKCTQLNKCTNPKS